MSAPELPTFRDGRSYFVQLEVVSPRGTELQFVLAPNGRKVWVLVPTAEDSPELRDRVADSLLHRRRYVRGVTIAPPYLQPGEPLA